MPILHQYEYSGAVASMEFFTVEVEKRVQMNALNPKCILTYINSVS